MTGNSIIRSTLVEFKEVFVENIPTVERWQHFNAYLEYSNQLKTFCGGTALKQWINGSFVTKKVNPGDIDMVTFVNHETLVSVGIEIRKFIYPQSMENFKVDAYIVSVYPPGSSKFFLYQNDTAYWIDQFSKTRRNRSGKKQEKSFLEIVY